MKKWLNKWIGRIFGDPIETARKQGYMHALTELTQSQTETEWDVTVIALEARCRASYGKGAREEAFCTGIKECMADFSDRH